MPISSTYTLKNIQEWHAKALQLLAKAGERRIWCLQGEVGTGKTTLIQALCNSLNVKEHITSPTFGLIHTYHTQKGDPVHHMDFYRLKTLQEVLDLGCEEFLTGEHYCFVEWPQLILPLLPKKHIFINLKLENLQTRTLKITLHD